MTARTAGTCVLVMALCGVAFDARSDDWWGRDKAVHFGLSVGLAAGGYGLSALVLEERWERATAGASFSLLLGVGKELYDLTGAGDPSWKDLAWDVAGTAVGIGIALLVDVLVADGESEGTGAVAQPLTLRWKG